MNRRQLAVKLRLAQKTEDRVPKSPADYLDYLWERQQKGDKRCATGPS